MVEEFFNALERAVAERNWYAALTLALTLPDICAQAEQPGTRTSGRHYKAWVEKHVVPAYTRNVGYPPVSMVFLSADDCYALRCALLHGGSADIESQTARKILKDFIFLTPGRQAISWHLNRKDDSLILMVDEFATDVLRAAQAWWRSLGIEQKQAAQGPLISLTDADLVEGI
ncbi:hypothetical protein [Streptomyces luteocolor]|uniref:hypothetical protein n=1 Tax=Streptomyces luteocolor TaxID=285500 RepID=UPI00114C8763|nr:hypothetical protein [Streptomyces luteocolor]